MRFWIDIANSPHAPFFAPLSRELEARGHGIWVTAWDRTQTLDLARRYWPDLIRVGAGASDTVIGKGTRIASRVRNLRRAAKSEGIDVALSHGSYGQILAGRSLRKRVITMMDYEHQPANHLAFRIAHVVIVPESFPQSAANRYGARGKLVRYPGYKEEVSLANYVPDAGFRQSLGVGDEEILVVARTPPEGALYHRHSNDLFTGALRRLAGEGVTILLSTRNEDQSKAFKAIQGVTVLERAVDGANLLSAADLVLGGGGTMTREAAVMGTPTYTLFSGEPAAVDEALIKQGRLTRISDPTDLDQIAAVRKQSAEWRPTKGTIEMIVDLIERGAGAG